MKMSRSVLVRWVVLNEICDDYENVDQIIFPDVAECFARGGLTIERAEVVDALATLVADGFAKAYLLSCWEPHSTELLVMPPLDVVEEYFETYFYITKEGMKAKEDMDARWDSEATNWLWERR